MEEHEYLRIRFDEILKLLDDWDERRWICIDCLYVVVQPAVQNCLVRRQPLANPVRQSAADFDSACGGSGSARWGFWEQPEWERCSTSAYASKLDEVSS